MTFEQTIRFDLKEIIAIIFECEKCGARIALMPDSVDRPPEACPSGHTWNWNVSLPFRSTDSPFIAFMSSLKVLRSLPSMGFKISFELSEGKREKDAAEQR